MTELAIDFLSQFALMLTVAWAARSHHKREWFEFGIAMSIVIPLVAVTVLRAIEVYP